MNFQANTKNEVDKHLEGKVLLWGRVDEVEVEVVANHGGVLQRLRHFDQVGRLLLQNTNHLFQAARGRTGQRPCAGRAKRINLHPRVGSFRQVKSLTIDDTTKLHKALPVFCHRFLVNGILD